MNPLFTKTYWQDVLHTFIEAVQTKKFWKELVQMTLGMFLGAAAVYYFLIPSHLIIGTISGLSIVINTLIGGNPDTFSYIVMAINAFLLLLAFLLIGNEFGAKTVYTAMILGPLTQVWDRVFPYTNFTHHVINNPDLLARLQAGEQVLDSYGNPYLISRAGELLEPIKSSVMAMGPQPGDVWFDLVCFVFLLSLCQAFEFRLNASTGGLDIIAKIINKYLHFDIGMSVTIGGVLICCTAFLINDFRMVIIGIVGSWVNGLVIDYFTATFARRKRVCIMSNEYERIRQYIVNDLVRGCSLYKVEGGFSGEQQTEIQVLLTINEFDQMMEFVHKNNIQAFITASDLSEVYGKWFIHRKRHGHVEIVNE